MSKLDELIRELCPDGVEYKKLSDTTSIARGVRVIRSQLVENGKYPVYQNCMTPLGYYYRSNCTANTTFIISAGAAGEVGYSSVDFWAADDCFYFICPENLDGRYLYHVLLNQKTTIMSQVRKASIPRLPRIAIDNLKIPIPPLPVQNEIVRILDNFTELTAELTAKLKAELSARKKQDEYYRDILISGVASNCAKKFLLDELSEFVTVGIANSATHAYSDSGVIMFRNQNIKANQLDDSNLVYILPEFAKKYEIKSLKKDDILVTRTGYPGQACLVPQKYEGSQTFTTLIIRLKKTREVSPAYISYFINSGLGKAYVNKMKSGAAQQNFGAKLLEKMPILLPPIEKQEKIVAILHRLDSLSNDISKDLSAEIEARQKQYEYYRDKLLTFKKLA